MTIGLFENYFQDRRIQLLAPLRLRSALDEFAIFIGSNPCEQDVVTHMVKWPSAVIEHHTEKVPIAAGEDICRMSCILCRMPNGRFKHRIIDEFTELLEFIHENDDRLLFLAGDPIQSHERIGDAFFRFIV